MITPNATERPDWDTPRPCLVCHGHHSTKLCTDPKDATIAALKREVLDLSYEMDRAAEMVASRWPSSRDALVHRAELARGLLRRLGLALAGLLLGSSLYAQAIQPVGPKMPTPRHVTRAISAITVSDSEEARRGVRVGRQGPRAGGDCASNGAVENAGCHTSRPQENGKRESGRRDRREGSPGQVAGLCGKLANMSVTVLPAGHRGPHSFGDFVLARPCRACEGEGRELYVEGSLLREHRIAIWGPRSLRRMARELNDMSPATLSQMERGILDFKEDIARAYLCALGVL